MSENQTIDVKANIFDRNDRIAEATNIQLTESGFFSINVMGAPGAGKTSTILALSKRLSPMHTYVVEGDIESDIDTAALRKVGIETVQINTHGACHLDAPSLAGALENLKLTSPGVIFVENIGNLVCPAEFQIGEHIKMLIVTTTEGSDKPYKYPLAFEKADIILVNKVDLIPYVDFDEDYFTKGIRVLNKEAPIIKVSARENTGFEEVITWLNNQISKL